MSARVRVLLVDDDVAFLDALEAILAHELTLEVVGRAATGREAVERALELRPDVVTMDLEMPQLDGLAATRELVALGLPVKVIVVSASHYGDRAEEARAAGAAAFLTKSQAATQLVETIAAVAKAERATEP